MGQRKTRHVDSPPASGLPTNATGVNAPPFNTHPFSATDSTTDSPKPQHNPKNQRQPSKRHLQREANVQAGLDELECWLQDLIRQGLASEQVQSYQFWDDIAARMVDAQAPGLARRLRDCASIPHLKGRHGQDWPEMLLRALGKLHLLVQGYRRIETLPSPLQAELRAQIGWPQKKTDILALAETTLGKDIGKDIGGDIRGDSANAKTVTVQVDDWQVLGSRILEEEKLWTQRVWLWGMKSDRPALILNYAYGRPNFGASAGVQEYGTSGMPPQEMEWIPGIIFPGKLVFYPSSYPLRALVKQMTGMVKPLLDYGQGKTVAQAIAQYGDALGQNPWLERMPFILKAAVPLLVEDQAYVVDSEKPRNQTGAEKPGHTITGLPIHPNFANMWELMALSGGHPMAIAAEWDGTYLWPLSVSVEGRLVIF